MLERPSPLLRAAQLTMDHLANPCDPVFQQTLLVRRTWGTPTWSEVTLIRTSRLTSQTLRRILLLCTLAVLPWLLSCSCATSQPSKDKGSTPRDLFCNGDSECEITDLDPEDCCAQCREPYAVAKAVRADWCPAPTNCLAFLQICREGLKSPRDYYAVCSRHKCERRSKWW